MIATLPELALDRGLTNCTSFGNHIDHIVSDHDVQKPYDDVPKNGMGLLRGSVSPYVFICVIVDGRVLYLFGGQSHIYIHHRWPNRGKGEGRECWRLFRANIYIYIEQELGGNSDLTKCLANSAPEFFFVCNRGLL